MQNRIRAFYAIVILFGIISCGPKAFVKGEYDDVDRKNLMNDQWSETDMQVAVKDLVTSMMAHPTIANATRCYGDRFAK